MTTTEREIAKTQPFYPGFVRETMGYLDQFPDFSLKADIWDAFLICFNSTCRADFENLFSQWMTVEDRKQMIAKYPLPDIPKSMVLYAINESRYAPVKFSGHYKKICECYLNMYLL